VTALDAVGRLRDIGGTLYLAGERLRYRIPTGHPEATQLLAQIRQNREAVVAALRDLESRPPSIEEVERMLPAGVWVTRYNPKTAPFAVAPVSIVVNAGKFFRAYLMDLRSRLAHPDSHSTSPLPDLLAKLAEAGLELRVEALAVEGRETPGQMPGDQRG
jgi:hypothetical protein